MSTFVIKSSLTEPGSPYPLFTIFMFQLLSLFFEQSNLLVVCPSVKNNKIQIREFWAQWMGPPSCQIHRCPSYWFKNARTSRRQCGGAFSFKTTYSYVDVLHLRSLKDYLVKMRSSFCPIPHSLFQPKYFTKIDACVCSQNHIIKNCFNHDLHVKRKSLV